MAASYIVAGARTPIGKLGGGLSGLAAPQLAAFVIRAVLERAGCAVGDVEEVILGQVLTAGAGQAPARQAALSAGLPDSVPALTMNKVCGSGLKAVMLADQAIRAGDAGCIVAGGMENMSLAPHLLTNVRGGWKLGDRPAVDSMLHDGLRCASEECLMGELADYTARKADVSRRQQDQWAAESHRRALAADAAGHFDAERIPVPIPGKKPRQVIADEGPRADSDEAALAQLRPAFGSEGSATPGNASQISDGAAAVLVVAESALAQFAGPALRIVATAVHGTPPKDLFFAPIGAVEKVLEKAGWQTADVDLWEINEAFASQFEACVRPLGIDREKVNVQGGAIALGHPIGASGARVLVTLMHAMLQRQAEKGVATLCLGGGNAVALAVSLT